MSIDISIVIVTYNSEKDIYPCLEAIKASNGVARYEVIIVDNGSTDKTCGVIKDFMSVNESLKIQLLKSENRGFNAGNNVGIKKAEGKFILLLNPDTEIFNDTLEKLHISASNVENLGALGCVMVDGTGKEIFSAGHFPGLLTFVRKGLKKNYVKINYDKELQAVDFPSGATFFFKKSLIEEIGLMDENYFIYYDETDFAYQMKKRGYQNYILTSTNVIHKMGQSTSQIPKFSIEKNIQSYFYFLKKNYNKVNGFFIKFLELMLHTSKYLLSCIVKKDKKSLFKYYLQTYMKNFRMNKYEK